MCSSPATARAMSANRRVHVPYQQESNQIPPRPLSPPRCHCTNEAMPQKSSCRNGAPVLPCFLYCFTSPFFRISVFANFSITVIMLPWSASPLPSTIREVKNCCTRPVTGSGTPSIFCRLQRVVQVFVVQLNFKTGIKISVHNHWSFCIENRASRQAALNRFKHEFGSSPAFCASTSASPTASILIATII